tara:strand:+ start:1400 stop:2341 length:942 start_codon:yes stop_codon:yes gene_type:complete
MRLAATAHSDTANLLGVARSAGNVALVDIVTKLAANPGVFCFGEVLVLDNVQRMRDSPGRAREALELLELLAYGDYSAFARDEDRYPDLKADALTGGVAQRKLKMLTLLGACSRQRQLSYASLQGMLGLTTASELEAIVLECIARSLLKAKMDPAAGVLCVEESMVREVRLPSPASSSSSSGGGDSSAENSSTSLSELLRKLDAWQSVSDEVDATLTQQIERCSSARSEARAQRQQITASVSAMKQRVALSPGRRGAGGGGGGGGGGDGGGREHGGHGGGGGGRDRSRFSRGEGGRARVKSRADGSMRSGGRT